MCILSPCRGCTDLFSNIFLLQSCTLTSELDLDSVKVNQHVRYKFPPYTSNTAATIPLLFVYATSTVTSHLIVLHNIELEMWANAQRDGHPAEYMRRPLFNAAKFG